MKSLISGALPEPVVDELKAAGLVPPGCRNIEIRFPADGVASLHFDVLIESEHLPVLAQAFARLAEEHEGETKPLETFLKERGL